MKERYDLLIIGATVYGAAAAERYKDLSVAVLESGCTCGAEFSAAWKGEKASPADNVLHRALSERRAVSSIRRASASLMAMGFSHMTWHPASSAAQLISQCAPSGTVRSGFRRSRR